MALSGRGCFIDRRSNNHHFSLKDTPGCDEHDSRGKDGDFEDHCLVEEGEKAGASLAHPQREVVAGQSPLHLDGRTHHQHPHSQRRGSCEQTGPDQHQDRPLPRSQSPEGVNRTSKIPEKMNRTVIMVKEVSMSMSKVIGRGWENHRRD